MKFFIDTANVNEIRAANDMGVIAGVTTNPSLIAKEGRDYAETLAEIATIVDGPISGEVKATTVDAETMVAEGEAIYALDPKHMVVKIPMTAEGLKAIKALSAKGIPTNCTLVFSANQALLAARAGATYVSPFLGRLDDIGQPGIELIETIHDMFLNYPDIDTQIKCFEISLLGLAEMDIDVLVFSFHLPKKREVESRTGINAQLHIIYNKSISQVHRNLDRIVTAFIERILCPFHLRIRVERTTLVHKRQFGTQRQALI